MPIPRRAATFLAAALLAAGCSTPANDGPAQIYDGSATGTSAVVGDSTAVDDAEGGGAEVEIGDASVPGAAASTPTSTAPPAAPSETNSVGTSTSDTDGVGPTASDTASSFISVPTGPVLPGGTEGLVEMVRRGWLDATSRFRLTAATAAQVTGAEATATVCDFLFGSVAEVAALTLLPPVSVLGGLSGPQVADDELRFACVYDVGGAPTLVLQVGTGPEIDPDLPGDPIIVTAGTIQAVLSYAPGRSGIDRDLAERYLTEAAGRLAVG